MTVSSSKYKSVFAISDFRHEVDDTCALLGYYAAYSGNSLSTFRDNLSVSSSRVRKSMKKTVFLLGYLDP